MKIPAFLFSPFIFPFYLVGTWLFISYLVSASGWRILAIHFTALSPPTGQRFSMQSLSIGSYLEQQPYKSSLTFYVNEHGVYLRPWFLFRAFHPPLFIPWDAFVEVTHEEFLWQQKWLADIKPPDHRMVSCVFWEPVGEIIAARVKATKKVFNEAQ